MATSAEQVFYAAVAAAEATRQGSKAAAFVTYQTAGFASSALAAYKTALAAADVAYITAVNAARNTAGTTLGVLGDNGPIPFANWASSGAA